MKIIKLAFAMLLLLCADALAQPATLSITLSNTTAKTLEISHPKKRLKTNFLKEYYKTLALFSGKSLKQTFEFEEPQFIMISCKDSSNKKELRYSFYISPGDHLVFSADFQQPDFNISVSGKGSNNNQPLLKEEVYFDPKKFFGDTLPAKAMAAINSVHRQNSKIFETYKTRYKPSTSFVKDWALKLKYQPISDYFTFKENNRYRIREAYTRTFPAWQKVQDSLFTEQTLNNNDAINVPEYLFLVEDFLGRKKEALWQEAFENPEKFYGTWYGTNIEEGKKRFDNDNTNELCEKIIRKYFKERTADYLYAILIEEAVENSHMKNIADVFFRYQQSYPKSKYVALFRPYVDQIIQRQKLQLTDEMIFAKENGKNLNTFEEVLALVKGKTVLLDMWGTWCGPCKEEMEKNSKAIKDYFHNKGVDYLYIANYDTDNEKKWKELIAYFELKGLHILANKNLSEDIMKKAKGSGYPTYVIIKRDGSFELSKTGYPMDRNVLIKQLEEDLAKVPEKK